MEQELWLFHIFIVYVIIDGMELARKFDKGLIVATIIAIIGLIGVGFSMLSRNTYANAEEEAYRTEASRAKFVTFFDEGEKLIVKTEARTVEEALDRADIVINKGDIVDPGLETEINTDNFYFNIYRARPVVVKDGASEKYLMTASFDPKTIMKEAGITVYDGDEIELVTNNQFLETGVASIYELLRNGGRMVTEEVEVPFGEETVRDADLPTGQTEVRQLGEVGRKKVNYNVLYVDNAEVSREVVSEEVVQEPVTRIVAVGVKKSIPPEAKTCASWARQAGVSEADLASAIDLIYHESGCRVDATNAYSGAYGIPQALPGSKMATAGADWETNPVTQIRWMASYVSRYGGWQGAVEWWYAHGWY